MRYRIQLIFIYILVFLCNLSAFAIDNLKELYDSNVENIVYIQSISEEKGETFKTYGTGFFIGGGYLITNAHVLLNKNIELVDYNGNKIKYSNKIILDNINDLAIIPTEFKGKGLKVAKRGIEIADEVFVISNSANFKNSLSLGIVSGIREVKGSQKIQFTAPIASGSSGAPIFNKYGEVVGVVNGIWSGDHAQNINFGISSNFILHNLK